MKRNAMISAILLAAGAATAGGLVFASQSSAGENDAAVDLAKAKVSLAQAIGIAEAHVGAKATRAELDGDAGRVAFQVEVVTADAKVFDVKVDAIDGKVLSSTADSTDRGEREDEKD